MKIIRFGLFLATGVHAGQATVSTEVPYPTQWSQPQVMPDGRVVPAVPTRFQVREVGVQFAPTATGRRPGPHRTGAISVPPLVIAAGKGDTNAVAALLAGGADVNGPTATGVTPLILAAMNGRVDVVKLLLAKNAEVNEATTEGKTALIYAAEKGLTKVAQVLLAAGADKMVMDEAGKMALEYAVAGNFTNVVALLKK